MSAHYDDSDEALDIFEATQSWIERRSQRLLKRRHLSRANRAELAELGARSEVLRRDVLRTWPEAAE